MIEVGELRIVMSDSELTLNGVDMYCVAQISLKRDTSYPFLAQENT